MRLRKKEHSLSYVSESCLNILFMFSSAACLTQTYRPEDDKLK